MKLNSWEMPNDEFAERVEDGGTFEHEGQTWQMLALPPMERSRETLTLRLGGREQMSPLWLTSRLWDEVWAEKNVVTSHEKLDAGLIRQRYHLTQQLELRRWNEVAHWCFDLSAKGWGSLFRWSVPSTTWQQLRDKQAFGWPSQEKENWRSETDALAWWRILKPQLEDANSDVRFALRFCLPSSAEQRAVVWRWRRGDYEEAQQVFRWALLAHSNSWPSIQTGCWHVKLPLPEQERFGFWCVPRRGYRELNDAPELARATEQVNAYFAPRVDSALLARSLCVQRWSGSRTLYFRIPFDVPTQHERLEAALKWREWLERSGA